MTAPDKITIDQEITETMQEAFFRAAAEYERMKRDRVFPRLTLPAFVWNAMIEAALSSPAPTDRAQATYKHKKSGGIYKLVGRGFRESDLTPVTIYESTVDHSTFPAGTWWERPTAEFEDGRFVPYQSAPGPTKILANHKICDLLGVREHSEGDIVELWRDRAGRLVIRAYNECGHNCTNVDLFDLIRWLETGSEGLDAIVAYRRASGER